jgi:uncharacterized protein (DUF433 family)
MSSASIAQPKQHIASTPGVCGGKPCVVGTRIRVWDIAILAQSGQSPDEILSHYPDLTLGDIYAALSYYYDNRQVIDQQAEDDERYVQQLHQSSGPGPLEQKMRDASPPTTA